MSFHDPMEALDDVRHSSPMSSEFFVEPSPIGKPRSTS
jgi:hypothetical protein